MTWWGWCLGCSGQEAAARHRSCDPFLGPDHVILGSCDRGWDGVILVTKCGLLNELLTYGFDKKDFWAISEGPPDLVSTMPGHRIRGILSLLMICTINFAPNIRNLWKVNQQILVILYPCTFCPSASISVMEGLRKIIDLGFLLNLPPSPSGPHYQVISYFWRIVGALRN